jgi:tripartite-type tricarboxylate transporter receptor subunit TctC
MARTRASGEFLRAFSSVVLVAVALAALAQPTLQAQDYPNRLIKMLQGFPPGGNVDAVARLLALEMSKGLGQTIIVESKPGLSGSLAAETVARADPDGYTLLTVASVHAVTGALSKAIKYRPVDDFEWISTVSFYPFVLTVRKDSKYRTLSDLLRAARADPGKLTYGSAGTGSIPHMVGELLANAAKVQFLHVPYRGEAASFTGLLSGDVDFVVNTTTVALPHVKAGDVRGLGVSSRARWKDLADVATIEESGLVGLEVISWTGIAATVGIPKPIAERLHAEVLRSIEVPEVRARLESFGAEVRGSTSAEMRALVERQIGLWAKLGKEANIQLE